MASNRRNDALFDRDNRNGPAKQTGGIDIDSSELDRATVSYYRERGRIRSELVLADWRISLTAYLLVVLVAFLWT